MLLRKEVRKDFNRNIMYVMQLMEDKCLTQKV